MMMLSTEDLLFKCTLEQGKLHNYIQQLSSIKAATCQDIDLSPSAQPATPFHPQPECWNDFSWQMEPQSQVTPQILDTTMIHIEYSIYANLESKYLRSRLYMIHLRDVSYRIRTALS